MPCRSDTPRIHIRDIQGQMTSGECGLAPANLKAHQFQGGPSSEHPAQGVQITTRQPSAERYMPALQTHLLLRDPTCPEIKAEGATEKAQSRGTPGRW